MCTRAFTFADIDEVPTHDFMRLVGHAGPVIATALDEQGARLYTAAMDRTVKVCVVCLDACVRDVHAHLYHEQVERVSRMVSSCMALVCWHSYRLKHTPVQSA